MISMPQSPNIQAILQALSSGGAPVGNNPASDLPLLAGLQIQKNLLGQHPTVPGSPVAPGPAFNPFTIAAALGKGQTTQSGT